MLPAATTKSRQQHGNMRTSDIYTVCCLFVLLMLSKSLSTPSVRVCVQSLLLSSSLCINAICAICAPLSLFVCVCLCVHLKVLCQAKATPQSSNARWTILKEEAADQCPTEHKHTHTFWLLRALVTGVSVSENTDKFNDSGLVCGESITPLPVLKVFWDKIHCY